MALGLNLRIRQTLRRNLPRSLLVQAICNFGNGLKGSLHKDLITFISDSFAVASNIKLFNRRVSQRHE